MANVNELNEQERGRRESLAKLRELGINKVAMVVFKRNEDGNAFWEAEGFTVREDLNYRNKALAKIVRMDT